MATSPAKSHPQIFGGITNIPFSFYDGDAKFRTVEYVVHVMDDTDGSVTGISSADSSMSGLFEVRLHKALPYPPKPNWSSTSTASPIVSRSCLTRKIPTPAAYSNLVIRKAYAKRWRPPEKNMWQQFTESSKAIEQPPCALQQTIRPKMSKWVNRDRAVPAASPAESDVH